MSVHPTDASKLTGSFSSTVTSFLTSNYLRTFEENSYFFHMSGPRYDLGISLDLSGKTYERPRIYLTRYRWQTGISVIDAVVEENTYRTKGPIGLPHRQEKLQASTTVCFAITKQIFEEMAEREDEKEPNKIQLQY